MGFSSTDPTIMGKSNELSGAQKRNRRKSEETKRKAEASKLRKISSLFKLGRAAFSDDEESTPLLQEQEDMETEICGPSTSEMNPSTASKSGTDPQFGPERLVTIVIIPHYPLSAQISVGVFWKPKSTQI